MKVIYELDKEDLGYMYDLLSEIKLADYNDEDCLEAWNLLPDHIKGEAVSWGLSDSVFRDNAYVHLKGLI